MKRNRSVRCPDLAERFAAVVDEMNEIEFAGRYDECLIFLRKNLRRVKREEITLRFAEKLDGGMISLENFASFVL